MISDVCWQAKRDIEWYQENIPTAYDDPEVKKQIERVKQELECLRIMLDTPPAINNN